MTTSYSTRCMLSALVCVFASICALQFAMPTLANAQALSPVKPPLKVIQLGNSYSAGNGARAADGTRNYFGVEGCYRSPTNWGSQFVESLQDVFAITYVNRACSGGVISHISTPRVMDISEISVADECPEPIFADEEVIVRSVDGSIARCERSLRPQIDAVDTSVDLVLMTSGGNDARFSDVVVECFATFLRDGESCMDAVDFANDQLDTIEAELLAALTSLRARMRSDARVVLVTYPHLVPDVNYRLSLDTGEEYAVSDDVRRLALAADARQQEAVAAANSAAGEDFVVLFDGTKELFEGHLPNPAQSEPRNPNRWIHEFESLPFINVEPYHFNALGHQNLADAMSLFGSFGAVGGSFDNTASDIDVAFVVDTTGSMGGEIAQVRRDLSMLVDQLATTTNSFRVAVVSYRDFPERTRNSADYPFRVDQSFSSELAVVQDAIDSLSASGGGDIPETVFSGINAAIGLPWRPGVSKVMLVIGDAPAFSPEPISELTAAGLIQASINVDPVQVVGVNVGNLDSNGALTELAEATGGTVVRSSINLTETISEILDVSVREPFAWMGIAYVGKTGEAIVFDGSGSFDPTGEPLTLYEWDFDGDGVFDAETTSPSISHVYTTDTNLVAILRVTGTGGTALASARVVTNAEGTVSQGDEKLCQIDEGGKPMLLDENGVFVRCTVPGIPADDAPGVVVTSGVPIVLTRDQWAQHSLPASFAATTVRDLFVGPLSEDGYATNWVVYSYSSMPLGYKRMELDDGISAGQGFWVLQQEQDVVTINLPANSAALALEDSDACASTTGCVRFPLPTDADRTLTLAFAGTPLVRSVALSKLVVLTEEPESACSLGCTLTEAAAFNLVFNTLPRWDAESASYINLSDTEQLFPAIGFWLATKPEADGTSPVLLIPKEMLTLSEM